MRALVVHYAPLQNMTLWGPGETGHCEFLSAADMGICVRV